MADRMSTAPEVTRLRCEPLRELLACEVCSVRMSMLGALVLGSTLWLAPQGAASEPVKKSCGMAHVRKEAGGIHAVPSLQGQPLPGGASPPEDRRNAFPALHRCSRPADKTLLKRAAS